MSEQPLQTYLPFHQTSFWEDFHKSKGNETLSSPPFFGQSKRNW